MMTARDFSKRFPWDAAFPGLLLACIGLGLMLLQVWKEGGRGVAAELLAESHAKVKHAVHRERGNQYSRELTELRNAGPNRQTAMAEIDALQKRASGGGGSALTVHSRAHKSRESDGLGRLAAAHGIGERP